MSPAATGRRPTALVLWPVLVSKLGNQLLILAVPLAIYTSTRSATLTALSFVASTLPFVLSPFMGVLVDRFDRRIVFGISEAIQLVTVLALAFLLEDRRAAVLVLMLLMVSSAFGTLSSIMVSYVLIPTVVAPDRLQRVNGVFSGATQLIGLVGLPLGGVIFGFLGVRTTLLCDAGTFLGTLALVGLMRRGSLGRGVAEPPLQALVSGARWLRGNPYVLLLSFILGFCNLGAGALTVLVIQLAKSAWNLDSALVGLAMAVGPVGAAAGSFIEARRKSGGDAGSRRFGFGLAVTVVGGAAMLATYWSPILLVGYFVLSIGEGIINVNSVLLRQAVIPSPVVGRVNAFIRMVVLGSVPLSGIIQSWLGGSPWALRLLVPACCSAVGLTTWFCLDHWLRLQPMVSDPGTWAAPNRRIPPGAHRRPRRQPGRHRLA